jgi:hypothetical protein
LIADFPDKLSQNDAAGLCSGRRVMKVILRQALIAIYVATTVVALGDFFIWMVNNGRPASETQQTPTSRIQTNRTLQKAAGEF